MSYPFIKCPTWREVREKLSHQGVSLQTLSGVLVGPEGNKTIVTYLASRTGKRFVIPDLDEDEIVSVTQLRSLCANLEINPGLFDLELD